MTQLRAIRAALLALAVAGASPAAMAQDGCVADIRQLPEGQQAMTLPEAMQRAGVSGAVVSAQLCKSGGGYVYRLQIRGAGGELKSIEIPAS